jgi:5'-3' exonuclease
VIHKSAMRIHLVDGTYELFRAYFGAPESTGPDGSEVGATRGLLRSFLSLLKEDGVSHVACAFDHKAPACLHPDRDQGTVIPES